MIIVIKRRREKNKKEIKFKSKWVSKFECAREWTKVDYIQPHRLSSFYLYLENEQKKLERNARHSNKWKKTLKQQQQTDTIQRKNMDEQVKIM